MNYIFIKIDTDTWWSCPSNSAVFIKGMSDLAL